eukprot:115187-Hanusia_phi.AAC.2
MGGFKYAQLPPEKGRKHQVWRFPGGWRVTLQLGRLLQSSGNVIRTRALAAGCVPIYDGADNVESFVPRGGERRRVEGRRGEWRGGEEGRGGERGGDRRA